VSALLQDLPEWPEVDFAAFGEIEVRKLSRVQKFAGGFLSRNWVAIPHVTHHDDADVTEMEQRRRSHNATGGAKITAAALLVRALVVALRTFPQFNASLDPRAKAMVWKKYFHIGVAVETPDGLLVPVLRDCDRKSLTAIAGEIATVAEKARTKGLSLTEMTGGCITLTSLGHIGGTGFSPIINAPEVAILGATRVRPAPVPGPDSGVQWRQMLPLSLSYDHRVINGADAARFVRCVADTLASEELFA